MGLAMEKSLTPPREPGFTSPSDALTRVPAISVRRRGKYQLIIRKVFFQKIFRDLTIELSKFWQSLVGGYISGRHLTKGQKRRKSNLRPTNPVRALWASRRVTNPLLGARQSALPAAVNSSAAPHLPPSRGSERGPQWAIRLYRLWE